MTPSYADLGFTLLLFNPDSAGNPLDHFSAEEAGLTAMNSAATIRLASSMINQPFSLGCTASLICPLVVFSIRAAQFLLPAAARLLRRLLHLLPASISGAEERGPHAHRPQGADHGPGFTGLLRPLQLHPPGQVGGALKVLFIIALR